MTLLIILWNTGNQNLIQDNLFQLIFANAAFFIEKCQFCTTDIDWFEQEIKAKKR